MGQASEWRGREGERALRAESSGDSVRSLGVLEGCLRPPAEGWREPPGGAGSFGLRVGAAEGGAEVPEVEVCRLARGVSHSAAHPQLRKPHWVMWTRSGPRAVDD